MKKLFFVLLTPLIFLIVITLVNPYGYKVPFVGKWVIPKQVEVMDGSLGTARNDILLTVSALAGSSGCARHSGLMTEQEIQGSVMTVDIKGYTVESGGGGGGRFCAAVMSESRASITVPLEWARTSGEKQIIFKLGFRENIYRITYDADQSVVQIAPIAAKNVTTRVFPGLPVSGGEKYAPSVLNIKIASDATE